jgi:signal peptidase I
MMRVLTKRRVVAVAIPAVLLAVTPAYLRAYTVSGASDAPTLLLGDTVVVNKAAFSLKLPYTQLKLLTVAQPKRGDLVLIMRPDRPMVVLKRVIGLPGEVVEIRDNRVIIDGQPLPLRALPDTEFLWVPESHKTGNTVYDEAGHWVGFTPGAAKLSNFARVHLASDEYFVLGDNRDNSLDCRTWGPLKKEAILGKVILTMPTGPRRKS